MPSPGGKSSGASGRRGGSTVSAPDVARELVDAMAYPSEARMLTRHVCRERCLHRFPEQWLTDELASGGVDLARPHRLSS